MKVQFLSHSLRCALSVERLRFELLLQDPRRSQLTLLRGLLGNLAASRYGNRLAVSPTDDYSRFRSKVPISNYEDLAGWLELAKSGIANTLTPYPILHFERTSGSSGPIKHIPYTRPLRRSFARMFRLWLHDLLAHGLRLKSGRFFMSVSPPSSRELLPGTRNDAEKDDDLEYVDPLLRRLLQGFSVLPSVISKVRDLQNYLMLVALHLLAEPNLEIVSVWSPTYLECIFRYITENRETLLRVWQDGPKHVAGLPPPSSKHTRSPCDKRIKILGRPTIDWQALWPSLRLISCWSSGNAKSGALRLANLFPTALVQGKGLLATEAPITLPLLDYPHFVPLLNEVFLEFEDDHGSIYPLWDLKQGNTYSVIITQRGGLTRYRLGDTILVTGLAKNTPCFDFVCRDKCSDMVGEKLHQKFVSSSVAAIERIANSVNILLPISQDERPPYYHLLSDAQNVESYRLGELLDRLLGSSYHYRLARGLGQLGPPKVSYVRTLARDYLAFSHQQGHRLGDIKVPNLIAQIDQAQKFASFLKLDREG